PGDPIVRGVNELRTDEHPARILWRQVHARTWTESIVGGGQEDRPALARDAIEPGDHVSAAMRVDITRIQRVAEDVPLLVTVDGIPVLRPNRAEVAAAEDRHRAAILLRTVDPVGKLIVGRDEIEFAVRHRVPGRPRRAAVDGNCRALVGSEDHAAW